jgi:predicted N-acetyltransferase YhbS
VSLDILTVDPAHHRKKVGHALAKWGTDEADRLGFEAVVESSVFGKGLYEKHGFVFQKDVQVKVPEFPDRPTGAFAWLIRPKQSV